MIANSVSWIDPREHAEVVEPDLGAHAVRPLALIGVGAILVGGAVPPGADDAGDVGAVMAARLDRRGVDFHERLDQLPVDRPPFLRPLREPAQTIGGVGGIDVLLESAVEQRLDARVSPRTGAQGCRG